jgi:hypothetical protein
MLLTNANANISDTTLTYRLVVSGVVGSYIAGRILVGTTVIGYKEEYTSKSYVDVTYAAAALYSAITTAGGLTDKVTFEVSEFSEMGDPLVGSPKKVLNGDITIFGRLTVGANWVTKPTFANPWLLDSANPVLVLSWTRPHTAFHARVIVDVWDGSIWRNIFNRYMFDTSSNFDLTAYVSIATIISRMGGASPRDVRVQLGHQIQHTSSDAMDIPGATNISRTNTSAVVHSFYVGSRVGIHDGATWNNHETYIFDGTTWNLQQVWVFNGTGWVESL